MYQSLQKTVGRAFCLVRAAPRAADGRALDAQPYGARRQSEAATALLLIQSRPQTPKRRRASLAAALHIFRDGCSWWYCHDTALFAQVFTLDFRH